MQLDGGNTVAGVDLKMSVVKPLSVKWLIGVYEFFQSHKVIIKNGFKEADIVIQ